MFEYGVEPIENKLLPYCGHSVCLLMKDGTRKLGRMTACRRGSVILNGDNENKRAATAAREANGRRVGGKLLTRSRKPLSSSTLPSWSAETAWDGMPFAPLSLVPLAFASAQRDQVPLQEIDSVLIL